MLKKDFWVISVLFRLSYMYLMWKKLGREPLINAEVKTFVKGYGGIHVFVEHPMNEPVELPVEDLEPLTVRPPGSEPKGVNALKVFGGDQQNEDVVYCVSSESEL